MSLSAPGAYGMLVGKEDEKAMANLGDQFRTGERAPLSGMYRYIQSITDDCVAEPEAKDIPVRKGERLPGHPQCRGPVTWELVSLASDV